MKPRRFPVRLRHPFRTTAIAVIVLSIAGVALTRCTVDGGLLDPDSAASTSQRDERQRMSDDAYRRLHQADVYNDVVDFIGAIDGGIALVDAAAKTSPPDTPVPVAQAADQAHSYLGRLARSARVATTRIDATPAPVWRKPLAPDTSPDYWLALQATARSAFTAFAESIEDIDGLLDDPTLFNDDARSRSIAGRIDAAATTLGEDVSALMKRVIIPTEATRTEVERRGYFADADHRERNVQ